MKKSLALGFLLFSTSVVGAFGQVMDVTIIQRQSSETTYDYLVAGHVATTTNSRASCAGSGSAITSGNLVTATGSANCDSSSSTNGWVTPAREVSFNVEGATYSVLLPDGRIAVVNCVSKFAEHMAGGWNGRSVFPGAGNRRSCRMPLVDHIQADFKGDKAKLSWVVSLDGKKKESETYKVLAVLAKQ
ncbi:MAG: hypothetical protein WBW84_13820 [Acidobacteriaceae bacterium]